MPQQKFRVAIPLAYGPEERRAIAQEIVDRIIERTRNEYVDKDGKSFPDYSDSYKNSFEFRVAGKGNVNLTLTGEMLDELSVLSHRRGEIEIGYPAGDGQLNDKVEGNITGSYGGSPNSSKARDFLGINEFEVEQILDNYPIDIKEQGLERSRSLAVATSSARDILSRSRISLDDNEDTDGD